MVVTPVFSNFSKVFINFFGSSSPSWSRLRQISKQPIMYCEVFFRNNSIKYPNDRTRHAEFNSKKFGYFGWIIKGPYARYPK